MTQSTTIAPSYLSLCIEDLAPEKVSTFKTQSTLWNVAAGVTFVAFTTLGVGAFIAVNLFMPIIYVPSAAITILLLAMPVASYTKDFVKFGENALAQAEKYKMIQDYYADFSKRSVLQIQQDLENRGIQWAQIPTISRNHPEKLADLNPILAQAKYLDTEIETDLELKEKMAKEADELSRTNGAENRKKIYELRNGALFAEERALQKKIQAAFTNAVLRNGDYKGSLETIGSQAPVTYPERILSNALNGDSSINHFFTFKNRNIAPLTYQDVKALSVSQLGQRLIAAMV